MTDRSTIFAIGGGALLLALLAASGRRPVDEAEAERESDGEVAAAGFNPGRFVVDEPEMGRLYQTERGALMLGKGPKSITYRVLLDAAELAGVERPEAFAEDSSRRVAYASLILAAPANAVYLTTELRRNDFRNAHGYGIDLRARPVLWLPIVDLDMLALGSVQVARYEEDGTLCTELPPEIREVIS